MDFGENLRCLRLKRKIGQKELAIYLHVSIGTISNYENNKHTPDYPTLSRIADFYNVSVDYLLDRTDYQYPVDALDQQVVTDYSMSDFINTMIELSPKGKQDLVEYLHMLKTRDKLNMRQSQRT